MNWLERKILLHLVKTFLERASTMKLSWHLVFQGIASAAQYGNQALDVAPAKFKPWVALAIGFLQLIAAWRAHWFNPDGTPASQPYVQKAIAIFALLALIAIAHPVYAQEPITSLYAGGISFNNSASPAIAGTGLYARKVSDAGTYAFTVVDALPNTLKPFTVTTNFSAGVAQKVFTIGKVPIFVPSAAGVSYSGSNVGWAWSTGAIASIPLKGNWRILPTVRIAKSSVSNGTGYQPIVGVLIGWGN